MNQNKKPVCKVCRDAGKPESVYTSHFVKSMNRCQIICPTLLNIKCRYCEEIGHTVKYCKSLNNQPSRSSRSAYEKVSQTTDDQPFKRLSQTTDDQPSRSSRSAYEKVSQTDNKTQNKFGILDFDDDEEEEEEIEQPLAVSEICDNVVGSYAAALAKPAKQQEVFQVPKMPTLVRSEKKRWADYDTDDDNDSISNCY